MHAGQNQTRPSAARRHAFVIEDHVQGTTRDPCRRAADTTPKRLQAQSDISGSVTVFNVILFRWKGRCLRVCFLPQLAKWLAALQPSLRWVPIKWGWRIFPLLCRSRAPCVRGKLISQRLAVKFCMVLHSVTFWADYICSEGNRSFFYCCGSCVADQVRGKDGGKVELRSELLSAMFGCQIQPVAFWL